MTRPPLVVLGLLFAATPVSTAAAADGPVWRVSLELNADGDGLLCLRRAGEPPGEPPGEPLPLTTLSGATATRLPGGVVRLEHDLTRPGALEATFRYGMANAAPRPGVGAVLSPRPVENRGGGTVARRAAAYYGHRLAAPLTVTADLAKPESPGFALKLTGPDGGMLQAKLWGTDESRSVQYFLPRGPDGRREGVETLIQSDRRPRGDRVVKHRFRLPEGVDPAGR